MTKIYAFGTRTYIKCNILGENKQVITVKTIEKNGEFYNDVPKEWIEGGDEQEMLDRMNAGAEADEQYVNQFKTEEEYLRHLDDNAEG